jgi:serine/threonine protein kinase
MELNTVIYIPKLNKTKTLSPKFTSGISHLHSDYVFFDDIFSDGKIVIKEIIGEGSYSKVYKCEFISKQLNILIALKISKKKSFQFIDKKKYSHEIDMIVNINYNINNIKTNHDAINILNYYGYFKYLDYECIVSEYSELGDLYTFLKIKIGKYETHIIDKIIRDILNGIKFLHRYKIYHNDLKPNNILIFKEDNGKYIAKISDFGLSNSSSASAIMTNQKSYALFFKPPNNYKNFYNNLYYESNTRNKIRGPLRHIDFYSFGILLIQLCQQTETPFPAFNLNNPNSLAEINSDETIIENAISEFCKDDEYSEYIRKIVLYCTIQEGSKRIDYIDYLISKFNKKIEF